MKSLAAKTALLAMAIAYATSAHAQPPRNSNPDGAAAVAAIEQTLVEAIARAEPSVVAISRFSPPRQPVIINIGDAFNDLRLGGSTTEPAATIGAGVIIDQTGLVLTQYLSVHEGDQHTITTIDGKHYAATIRAADPRSGLAVLAIDAMLRPQANQEGAAGVSPARPANNTSPGSFPAIRFGDAATLRKGQFVVAIGNPFAIENDGQPTASWGIVTNLSRRAPTGTNFNDAPGPAGDYRTTLHHLGTLIQTDAKLGWNAGGGALINMRGELVGITTTASTIAGHEQPAGYAIPLNATMRRIIDTLKQGREVEYGMLGVSFNQSLVVGPAARAQRLTLAQVYPGSPAARAGLATGDVITSVGDQPVDDVDAVQLAVSMLPPLSTTKVGYERDGRRAEADVTLAKLAVAGKPLATVGQENWQGLRVDYGTALDANGLAQAISSGTYDEEGCVLVVDVEENSPAWNAGVRPGMFISHAGGKRVSTPAEFQAAVRELGDKFDIRLTKPASPEKGK